MAENYGTLYMIPSPISDEASLDVLAAVNAPIIRSLSHFVVENTRTSRRFLSRLGMGRPIEGLKFEECNEHTRPEEIEGLLAPLLAGESVGVISEAGLPGIADPGAAVVAACHRKGIKVVPLSGPSSIFMALMASGQNGQSFAFNGYLPVKPHERRGAIRKYEQRALSEGQSQIFIETPYRNGALMEEMLQSLGSETVLTVAADLTAPTEYIRSATVRKWRTLPRPEIHKRPAIFIIGR